MEEGKFLVALVAVFAALAALSFGYIYVFSPLLGGPNLSPGDSSAGVQFSPGSGCKEICSENNIFMGCQRSFDDFSCGVSCKGVYSGGPNMGEPARIGVTTCQFTECVCN